MLPFSYEQFMAVFVAYNQAIWPAQIVAVILGLAVVYVVWRPRKGSGKIALLGLASMWLWTGLFYHFAFFNSINKAALGFAALFVIQGLVFLWRAIVAEEPEFGGAPATRTYAAVFLIFYSLVLYPAIGVLLGHRLVELPSFGVTPCPVTIFTFGILLLARQRIPIWLLIIPLAWSIIGGSAAFLLQVPQDWLLLISGIGSLILMGMGRQRQP